MERSKLLCLSSTIRLFDKKNMGIKYFLLLIKTNIMKRIMNTLGLLLILVTITFNSCEPTEVEPEKKQADVSITTDIDGIQVAFVAVVANMTDITEITWNFGELGGTTVDDGDADGKTVLHYYESPGTYAVWVKVTGNSDYGVLTKKSEINITIGDDS